MTDLRPLKRHRGWIRLAMWGAYAALMLAAPLLWRSSFALTMLSQMGIAIIVCLAYNVLLGQGGMLSFGHAVYSGLGAYLAIHTLNRVAAGDLALPVSLVPLAGGAAGLLFAALLGYVTTRKAGTSFAMITLGIGELVWSLALMLPEFFGGEGGISANRVVGPPVLGISFGPQIELYHLIAIYCFICTAALYAFTRTPLGRILNAVRDNPERVEFIGYSTRSVRWLAFMVSGLFAGIGGGLAALNEVLGAARSGAYLLFVFLGGAGFFVGPIIGAVLMVIALVLLSELTAAWLLYLGLVFVVMVVAAPGGIASLVMANGRIVAAGQMRALLGGYLALGGSALAVLIEMLYHRQLDAAAPGPTLNHLGVALDVTSVDSWIGAAWLTLVGAGLFELCRRPFARQWQAAQLAIEDQIRRRGELP